MTSSVRTQIRAAYKAALIAAATRAAGRVYGDRHRAMTTAEDLPAIRLELNDGETQRFIMSATAEVLHTAELLVKLYLGKSGDGLDDALDDFEAEVAAVIGANNLDGLLFDTNFTGSRTDFDVGGSLPLACKTMRYEILFQTRENDFTAVT